jgi:hypothetical protein
MAKFFYSHSGNRKYDFLKESGGAQFIVVDRNHEKALILNTGTIQSKKQETVCGQLQ